jgi:hypothetical protein
MFHIRLQGLKCIFIAAILIGLVPFLLGLLFELIVVIPLRVPYDQTPLYFPWQVSKQYTPDIHLYRAFLCESQGEGVLRILT